MTSRLRLFVAAGLAALALTATRTAAAQSATISVSATVQTPLTLTPVRTLDFTTVFPGVAKSVTIAGGTAGATSGVLQIAGQASANVQVSFTLPANLTSGANTLPISFGAGTACINAVNSTAGCVTFDPSASQTRALDATTGQLFVLLGGTVTPSTTQAAGSYSGTVTVNVAYTGA